MTNPDPSDLIRSRLPILPVPFVPEVRLHQGRPDSGLARFAAERGQPGAPFWAYPWSGGLALARYILDNPGTVRGRRVLDLGAGGGLVAIAAALAGADRVLAAETDPAGIVALQLNAAANAVALEPVAADLLAGTAPEGVACVLVGDLFYEARLARRVTRFLERCRSAGIDVLIGDPGRAALPVARLRPLATFAFSPDRFGETAATVYAFAPDQLPLRKRE